ncbi:hypothetical protein IGI04_022917 [Brassica rapa subsp. trilocularis]|uniref:Uncharacterized protein n=1 Tax=Brassica rapa subsp. trilocularis TaxID=1813537 RepID=A0ABQ7M5S0_BRACM|nr:hypothetical protein IGI04_022917 [Brassica rapa subsp. trilocularis]
MAMNPVKTSGKSPVHPERTLNQQKFEMQFWSSDQTLNQARKLRIGHIKHILPQFECAPLLTISHASAGVKPPTQHDISKGVPARTVGCGFQSGETLDTKKRTIHVSDATAITHEGIKDINGKLQHERRYSERSSGSISFKKSNQTATLEAINMMRLMDKDCENFGIHEDEYHSIVSRPSRSRFHPPCFTFFAPSVIARIGKRLDRLKKGNAKDSQSKVKTGGSRKICSRKNPGGPSYGKPAESVALSDLEKEAVKHLCLRTMKRRRQRKCLGNLIRAMYSLLGFQAYFTSGEKETRAWTVHVFEFPISLHSMGFLGVMRLHMKIYSLLALFLQQKRRLCEFLP